MKGISTYVNEKLKFGKDFRSYGQYDKKVSPDTIDELKLELIAAVDKCDDDSLDLNHIDVSNVDNFYYLFSGSKWISNRDSNKKLLEIKHMHMDEWDVSNAWNFNGMFNGLYEVEDFGISDWNLKKAENMSFMFNNCKRFNEDISKWRTPRCYSMNAMFSECHDFNQDLSKWDISHVKYMNHMLDGCKSMDQDFEPWVKWDLSNVDTGGMFDRCPKQEKPSWYDEKRR